MSNYSAAPEGGSSGGGLVTENIGSGERDRQSVRHCPHPRQLTPVPWVQVVRESLARAQRWQWTDTADSYHKRRTSKAARGLPYCLHRTENPEVRCVINRRYRIVGAAADVQWSDYEALTGWHVQSPHFETLRGLGVVNEGGYFFNDGSQPWRSREHFEQYRAKVEALLAPFVERVA